MPKAFTERDKELIRARLIQAGDKQFSAYGLKKTNIDALARAARISKGAFYLFYDSKEALFMDVAEVVEQQEQEGEERVGAGEALQHPDQMDQEECREDGRYR